MNTRYRAYPLGSIPDFDPDFDDTPEPSGRNLVERGYTGESEHAKDPRVQHSRANQTRFNKNRYDD